MAELTRHHHCGFNHLLGHAAVETMPLDRCVYFYDCPACRVVLRPKPGDCCVYCSFGDKRCPFVQDDCPCPDA